MKLDVETTRIEEVVLADGRDAVLRPLVSEDRLGLETLFSATSSENLYTRFFGLGPETITRHLDHLFADSPAVIAYVVTSGARILGVADVEVLDRTSAEIAFLVADDTHGCGVATLLLERAAGDARSTGIEWFVADVLAINHLMLQVFADIGFAIERHSEGCDVSIRMNTELNRAARDATDVRTTSAKARRAGLG